MSVRYQYRIKIISRPSAPTESTWTDVLTTEVVTTRSGVVAIAARFQKIYPRPGHRVLVHLLERAGEPLQVDWETLEGPGNGPQ